MRTSRLDVGVNIRIGLAAAAVLWVAAVVDAREGLIRPPSNTWLQAVPPASGSDTRSVLDGVFTDAQAKRGQDVYAANCAHCHGATLQGGDEAPSLGGGFLGSWKGTTVADLVNKVRSSMPDDAPASLTDQQYTDVVTFILSSNRYPSGQTELPIEPEKQKLIRIEPVK